ncbi:MAG TPA: Mth938-like domain-containing protein [Burkholderiaceae bacterium]
MKLHSSPTQHYQTVTAYDDAGVEINAVRHTNHLLVMPELPPQQWLVAGFDSLQASDFEQVLAMGPDVVILGTGARQRFIHPSKIAALTARRIGVESMDSKAACRTYNILMGEGRRALLALLLETPSA